MDLEFIKQHVAGLEAEGYVFEKSGTQFQCHHPDGTVTGPWINKGLAAADAIKHRGDSALAQKIRNTPGVMPGSSC